MRRNHRVITPFALALAIGVIAAPAASGKPIVSAAEIPSAAPSEQAGQDARSQPAMDVATASLAGQDAPSQPAMDAATAAAASPTQSVAETASAQSVEESGFDWGDAGIGAFGVFGLTLIGAGGLFLLHRRRTQSMPSSRASAVTS